ncbi:hypothetical protein [Synechococcus sp. HK01-R]|uniref:hypothetical protein n=1 Tax=Synechococcus sp. HK01-R TaxID=2751171 RepID=UPI00162842DB|nr:hypothetical protein [Synechococcus sp. HK01-R]QNG27882.1 hypothetical protein H0O21_04720 [Synechococcus sp. HK01-R]
MQKLVSNHKSLLKQLLLYIYLLFQHLGQDCNNQLPPLDVLIYVGSDNQYLSLKPTIDRLKALGLTVAIVSSNSLKKQLSAQIEPMKIGIVDFLIIVIISLIRLPYIFFSITKIRSLIFANWFCDILSAIFYLYSFSKILRETSPKIVITSNDHNVANRSFTTSARSMNIKSAYLQHGNVSNVFPFPLFDYAFLFGQYSLNVYESCFENKPVNYHLFPKTHFFLTGMTKPYFQSKHSLNTKSSDKVDCIGVAVSSLDDLSDVFKLVDFLLSIPYQICIRFHPGLGNFYISKVMSRYKHSATFSTKSSDCLTDYLGRISCLIAGDSGIHLEAAISKVPTVYYQFSKAQPFDIFGYVANGLSIHLSSVNDSKKVIHQALEQSIAARRNAIRYYISSYDTRSYGAEPSTVAEAILSLVNNKTPSVPFSILKSC